MRSFNGRKSFRNRLGRQAPVRQRRNRILQFFNLSRGRVSPVCPQRAYALRHTPVEGLKNLKDFIYVYILQWLSLSGLTLKDLDDFEGFPGR